VRSKDDKETTKIVQILHGDDSTVNVATGHPYEPLLAISGIDYTVKLFSPDLKMQRAYGEMEAGVDYDSDSSSSSRSPSQAGGWQERGGRDKEYSGRASRRRYHEMEDIVRRNMKTSDEMNYEDEFFNSYRGFF
jgi:nuclear receptor interaction protein